MNFHPGIKPALWGAVVGAAAISVIGFSSMGWMLGGTAERMAADRAQSAVIEKGGWAATPGSEKTNSAVASACAEKLGQPS